MPTVFLFCALIGGTFLVCQFVMTLIGLGHGSVDMDVAHAHLDSLPGHVDNPLHGGVDHDVQGTDHHGSSWLFGIISFRTMVAATTFFGLAGMTAHSGGLSLTWQLMLAIASGGAAMFVVHGLMRLLYQLGQSGTLRITNAIGKTATVSVSIPGNNAGPGKVRLTVQGRLEELPAVTATQATLAAGSQVLVIDIVSGNVLAVTPYSES